MTTKDAGAEGFHARDGWFFKRLEDGRVRLQVATPDGKRVLHDVVLDASSWASVVASVSARGENWATYRAAMDSHYEEAAG